MVASTAALLATTSAALKADSMAESKVVLWEIKLVGLTEWRSAGTLVSLTVYQLAESLEDRMAEWKVPPLVASLAKKSAEKKAGWKADATANQMAVLTVR